MSPQHFSTAKPQKYKSRKIKQLIQKRLFAMPLFSSLFVLMRILRQYRKKLHSPALPSILSFSLAVQSKPLLFSLFKLFPADPSNRPSLPSLVCRPHSGFVGLSLPPSLFPASYLRTADSHDAPHRSCPLLSPSLVPSFRALTCKKH